jgi:hypothetical protein
MTASAWLVRAERCGVAFRPNRVVCRSLKPSTCHRMLKHAPVRTGIDRDGRAPQPSAVIGVPSAVGNDDDPDPSDLAMLTKDAQLRTGTPNPVSSSPPRPRSSGDRASVS